MPEGKCKIVIVSEGDPLQNPTQEATVNPGEPEVEPTVVANEAGGPNDVPVKTRENIFVESDNNGPPKSRATTRPTPITDAVKGRLVVNNDFYHEPFIFKESDRDVRDLVASPFIGTDKSKMTRKQSKASKHGHENQKSTKPKPEKSSLNQIQAKMGEISQINALSIPLSSLCHVAMEKAQWNVGFYAKTLTKEAQTSHQWNDTLAIFRCPQLDQTAIIDAWMIEEMIGQD
ncbi:hypothetical protein Tco_0469717 [Tanacetum coccineum]